MAEPGLTKHARDKLLAELQSGAMTSGVVSIDVGQLPAAHVQFDSWPKAPAPVHGMLTDPETGQSWRIRLNQETRRWEVLQSSEAARTEEGSRMQYVAWDYEAAANPPYYHIFSTDAEPMALELAGTLFTITAPQSAQMDALITRVCEAIEATIAYATMEHLINDQGD